MNYRLFVVFDTLAIIVISAIFYYAFYIQLVHHELPCPLCLAQRMGLLAVGLGPILNLYFGVKARHYAISSIIALISGAISMLQILMHIVPETGHYGSPLFGLHLYTWGFILSSMVIFVNLLLITLLQEPNTPKPVNRKLAAIIALPLITCIMANAISAFAECGFNRCPPDPKSYWISKHIK